MRITRIISSLLLLLAFNLHLNAQISKYQKGNSETEQPQSSEDPITEAPKSSASPDTASTFFFTHDAQAAYHLYPFRVPLHDFSRYTITQFASETYANTGNTGSAARPLTFQTPFYNGFRFRNDAFDPYKYSLDSLRFFLLDKPFTELRYVMGKGKEQQLLVSHSQQVKKGLFLGLHARFANAPGMYLRQRTYYATGYFTLQYTMPNKRYGVIASYLNDRFRLYESGGLTYDSVFRENTESNRKTISVNLGNAMNRQKNSGLMVQHYFNLQKNLTPTHDSLPIQARTRKFNAGRLVHTFRYFRETAAYQDDKNTLGLIAGLYPAIYGDSVSTLDSLLHMHIENSLVYSNIEPDTSGRSFPFQYSFGIRHHIDRLGFYNIEQLVNQQFPFPSANEITALRSKSQTFEHLMPFGTLKGIIAKKTFFIANGRLSLGGYNNGDYQLSGSFYQYINLRNFYSRLYASVSQSTQHPDYFFQQYASNHFRWNNDFGMLNLTSGMAGIDLSGLRLEASITHITNFTYLDETASPVQYAENVTIKKALISKVFHPGRWIIDAKVTFQDVAQDSVLSLPQWTAEGSLSYNLLLFKKVLLAEIGIHGLYFSSYYADAYSPALRMFYRQNVEKFGDYPYLDAFINMKIKRARLFLKYQHFNAGWLGYSYYMTPHYPMADAAFKFGVSWVFYD